eukprot:SAG31_NODE_3414_length_4302_cov_20.546239_7_plen_50_part_00
MTFIPSQLAQLLPAPQHNAALERSQRRLSSKQRQARVEDTVNCACKAGL